jgi:hypothetical protein
MSDAIFLGQSELGVSFIYVLVARGDAMLAREAACQAVTNNYRRLASDSQRRQNKKTRRKEEAISKHNRSY